MSNFIVISTASCQGAGPSSAAPSMPVLDTTNDTIVLDDSNQDTAEEAEVEGEEEDEYHDAAEPMDDDDFFAQHDIATRSGIQPLLPDDFGDEALAGIKFGEEFGNR